MLYLSVIRVSPLFHDGSTPQPTCPLGLSARHTCHQTPLSNLKPQIILFTHHLKGGWGREEEGGLFKTKHIRQNSNVNEYFRGVGVGWREGQLIDDESIHTHTPNSHTSNDDKGDSYYGTIPRVQRLTLWKVERKVVGLNPISHVGFSVLPGSSSELEVQ